MKDLRNGRHLKMMYAYTFPLRKTCSRLLLPDALVIWRSYNHFHTERNQSTCTHKQLPTLKWGVSVLFKDTFNKLQHLCPAVEMCRSYRKNCNTQILTAIIVYYRCDLVVWAKCSSLFCKNEKFFIWKPFYKCKETCVVVQWNVETYSFWSSV